MDRRKLKKVLAGLGITGLIASTALAGTITANKKTIPIEKIPVKDYSDPVSGDGLTNATIKLDGGLTSGSKIKFTLTNGNFTGKSKVQICQANGTVLGDGTVTPDVGNNTVEVTLSGNLTVQTYYVLSGNADNGTDCSGLPIKVMGGLNVGDKVSISGEVVGIGEVLSSADLYEIGQQFTAKVAPKISYIDPGDLTKFTDETSSKATLYLSNATVSWPLNTSDTTNKIKVSVSGDDWTGVKYPNGVTYCGNTLNNSTAAPKVFSGEISINGTCVLKNTSNLSIEVTGNDVLTPRVFKTTVTNGTGEFKRDMEYLKDFVTHKWEYGATTFYIPFVRHNVAQNAFTVIKIQAAKSDIGSKYTVSASVLKSDGSWEAVSMPCQVDGTPTSTFTAGKTCVINGEVLTAAAGKDETMARILINAPEANVSCYAVYDFQGKSRRVPCKVDRKVLGITEWE
jgi:radical SAM modification target selenobiotic family peptide